MGIGDWGLGIGDWGLGIGPNPQSPIHNPPTPNTKTQKKILKFLIIFKSFSLYYFLNNNFKLEK